MMLTRLLTALALILTTSLAHAACTGDDLRPRFTLAEQAELAARVAATPYPNGNYWIATRGAQRLHVVGTIHIEDARLAPMMERITPVLQNAQRLFVEATLEEQAKLEKAVTTRPELLFITEGPTLPDLMPEADWQALAAAATERGLPAFMVAKFQPWYLSVMLSMPACALADMAAGRHGLDHMIMDAARAANVPQSALEPYDTLFTLMGAEPLEQQVEYLSLGIMPNDVAEDALATLKNSYFDENPAEVFEFNRILARSYVDLPAAELDVLMDDLLYTMLDARNLAWLPALLAAPDGDSVVAVGAGHLPGENGVLNLLARNGFALTRQRF